MKLLLSDVLAPLYEEFTDNPIPQLKSSQNHSQVARSIICHRWVCFCYEVDEKGPVAEVGIYEDETKATQKIFADCFFKVVVRPPKDNEAELFLCERYVIDVHLKGITNNDHTCIKWDTLDLSPFRQIEAGRIFIRTMTRTLQKNQ